MKPIFTIEKPCFKKANKCHEDQTSQNEMNILLRYISTLPSSMKHHVRVLNIIVLIATKLTLTR